MSSNDKEETVTVNDEFIEVSDQPGDLDAAAQCATDAEHDMPLMEAFRRYPWATFWAVAMSFTIVMEGYDTFLLGQFLAYPQFNDKYGQYYPNLDKKLISASWQAGIAVASTCGAILGLIANGYLTERFGHRKVCLAALVLLTGFIFIPFFAPTISVLVVGMVLEGIPFGIFAIQGPSYASEVCPLALRGFLTSFVNICWVIGQLIAAGVLQAMVTTPTQWSFRLPLALQWIWPVPLFVLICLAPESPYWLVRKDRLADAEKSLQRLAPHVSREETNQRLAMILRTNNLEKAMKTENGLLDCFRGPNLRRTEAACVVLASQSLCGQPFAYTTSYFFVQAGLAPSNAYKLNFGGTALAFIGTCLSWVFMTRVGRRPMIIAGLSIMTMLLLVVGVISWPAEHNVNVVWAQGALLILWLGVYSTTLGPQSFALSAEVSATRLRSQTLSIARNAYNVVFMVDQVIEPYFIAPTELNLKGKTSLIWMGVSVVLILWCIFRLPETRNLTYEELDVLFEKRTPAWKFGKTDFNLTHETNVITAEKTKKAAE